MKILLVTGSSGLIGSEVVESFNRPNNLRLFLADCDRLFQQHHLLPYT
jgi:FlaA1/EpsC-like NDP-sugar epimerase